MNLRTISCVAAASVAVFSYSQITPPKMGKVALMRVPDVLARSTNLGHADPNMVLHVTLSFPYGDQKGLEAFNDSVSDPASPNYRQFLEPSEVGERFGISTDKITATVAYLKAKGFHVTTIATNRMGIITDCTVAQAESAFGIKINNFKVNNPAAEKGRPQFFSYTTAPMVPAEMASYVVNLSGLQNFYRAQPRTVLSPAQSRQLYGLAPLYNAGFRGQGRAVGVSNFDGFRLSNLPLLVNRFGLPVPASGVGTNVKVISVGGGNGQAIAAQGEGDLDFQLVLAQAPLCTLYIYDGGDQADLVPVLMKESSDNLVDIVTESYGWRPEPAFYTSCHNIHLAMTAQGITYMEASGDFGTDFAGFDYSDFDPEVLQVGGTDVTTDNVGNRLSETGWDGSGGGWSLVPAPFNTLPTWLKGKGVPTAINKRILPDVSLMAAPGAYYFFEGGKLQSQVGGTSCSSPTFAGALAVAQQRAINNGGLPPNKSGKRRVGRIQDLIYRQNGRADTWYDITSGNNGFLPNGSPSNATVGWDYVTGWGAINWNAMNLQSATSQKINGSFLSVIEGTPLNGSGNALSQDGVYFRITPATVPGLGQVGSASYLFTLPANIGRSSVQEIDYTVITKFSTGTTGQLFLFNYSTGKWDLLRSYPTAATPTTLSAVLKTNLTTYISAAGQYRVLVRGLLPTSGGVTGNSFDEDYVNTVVQYLPS